MWPTTPPPPRYYVNQKDGTFKDQAIEAGVAYSPDGKPQAGMGVSIGDYNRDGLLDIVKTNFAGDTDSLFMNLGDGSFDDRTYQAGLGMNTRLLGWGVSFIDYRQRRLARHPRRQRPRLS